MATLHHPVVAGTVWKHMHDGETEYAYLFKVHRDYIVLKNHVGSSYSSTMTLGKFDRLYVPAEAGEGLRDVRLS